VAQQRLRGVLVRDDFADKQPNPPVVDLSRLLTVPFIDDFGMSPGLNPKRFAHFEALYQLRKLRKLGMHNLANFPKVEMLFLTDGPNCASLESLSHLQYARIWKLNDPDLSILAKLPRLTELQLIQMHHQRIQGLDKSATLSTLELSYCPKLLSVAAIPTGLTKFILKKCAKLRDLTFLLCHPNLEFLYVDIMESLAFVPGLLRLAYVGFENVLDGNLSPLLESASVTRLGCHPGKRKHYSHSLQELAKLLDAKRR
jgi:hypothetical protein